MRDSEAGPQGVQALDQVLGYLNFSAGAPDVQFLANLNRLYGETLTAESAAAETPAPGAEQTPEAAAPSTAGLQPPRPEDSEAARSSSGAVWTPGAEAARAAVDSASLPPWRRVVERLERRLAELAEQSGAFRDPEQARQVLRLVAGRVLPGYLEFHRDLLFHQTERTLFNGFFLGRACEATLKQGAPWEEDDRIVRGAIARLNDYIGYRPIAVLENRRVEPYPHEWLRPVPLYIRGAGVAAGPHADVVAAALELLQSTDEDILRQASFDPQLLDELAFDPRAYDFDHPANKRPNHHFGQWDPHQLDSQGRYRRFVVQQVTLDALMTRVTASNELTHEEAVFEGGAVLAGTVLMASGVCGSSPETHHSDVTLGNLLPRIARYRDQFYERLLKRASNERAARLKAEAVERQQPFGGARQHLNAELARRRASQLEHVHLAKIFARMGYPDAATRQADVVPTASARMLCQIDCWIAAGRQAIEAGQPAKSLAFLEQTLQLLRRAIECGAMIDPWNILGFDAHFSLFPAVENSIHDHRADELCGLMERLFDLMARVWSESAARDEAATAQRTAALFRETAAWWHKFATHEVESVESIDGQAAVRAAERVSAALALWHQGGAAAGNVAFWAPHADMFDTPHAYCLVADTLLEKRDYVASMALLIHWLGQADRVGLASGESTFPDLAERWMSSLLNENGGASTDGPTCEERQTRWRLARKFFDYVEANAEHYWKVPSFDLTEGADRRKKRRPPATTHGDDDLSDDENDDGREPYGNAYIDVVFKGTTEGEDEGSVVEGSQVTHDELMRESRRLQIRLQFLATLSRLWKTAALSTVKLHRSLAAAPSAPAAADAGLDERLGYLLGWFRQTTANHADLLDLLEAVRDYKLTPPSSASDSMIEYDQKRFTKESLMEQIVETALETIDARRFILAAAVAQSPSVESLDRLPDAVRRAVESLDEEQRLSDHVLALLLRGDADEVRARWPELLALLGDRPLLYVPLSKRGQPREIVSARLRQRTIQDLLVALPRVGLLPETCELIETAREMERRNPVGPGAVTEFDELFKIGFKALIESLVESSSTWSTGSPPKYDRDASQRLLVECLERITEALLANWLEHSKTLRLSVLEKVHDQRSWKRLVGFIETYGADLFTQHFLNLANIRSILHRGVDSWLQSVEKEARHDVDWRLLNDLDDSLPRLQAVEQLTLVLEAIHENYGEYRDYNSTTTQSDRGELLYTLLDFLRLRTRYDRIAWNLKPVVWAHEVLVRNSCGTAAKIWRRALHDRIASQANQFLTSIAELQRRYAMRMPTIADRLGERFVRSMAIDRIRALVGPAMRDARLGRSSKSFSLLEQETEVLTREPTGVGLDVPAWLTALEEEVQRGDDPLDGVRQRSAFKSIIPVRPLSWDEVRRQLERCGRQT